jgi:hypothetical protein
MDFASDSGHTKANGANPDRIRAVGVQGQKMSVVRCQPLHSVQRRRISVALMPPKPKEFDSPISKLWAMALLGT